MKIEIKEIYKCEHCNKLYQIKNKCLEHEKVCNKNPDNQRACFGCRHLEKKNYTIYEDHHYGGELERKVELLHCPKINSFLYPPKVEHKKNWYETDPMENKPMPRTCKVYDDESTDLDEFFNCS